MSMLLQAGPAKTLKIDKYRCAPLSFSRSDLKFWHAIQNRLAKTLLGELKTKNENPLTFRPFYDHGKRLAGRMSAVFLFFFWTRQVLFWWARSESRVKISGPNFKNWEVHGQVSTEVPLHTNLHIIQGFIHNFRTKVTHEMKSICPYSSSQDVHAPKN